MYYTGGKHGCGHQPCQPVTLLLTWGGSTAFASSADPMTGTKRDLGGEEARLQSSALWTRHIAVDTGRTPNCASSADPNHSD